jgi:hypothetical protein
MNVIHGKMDPYQFFQLYQNLAPKYADDVMQDMLGFADDAEFQRLVNQTAKVLPTKAAQEKFKQQVAEQEINTVKGLHHLLNYMINKYGDTLPYGYMVVDYGGKKSIWLQVSDKTYKSLEVIGDICMDRSRTMDDFVGKVVQLIARGDAGAKALIDAIVAETPPVVLPGGVQALPTKEHIAKMEEVGAG